MRASDRGTLRRTVPGRLGRGVPPHWAVGHRRRRGCQRVQHPGSGRPVRPL